MGSFAVLLLFLLEAVLAVAESCTGASAKLPTDECAAWIAFFEAAGGSNWEGNGEGVSRTDPCGTLAHVGDDPAPCNAAGTAIVSMYVTTPTPACPCRHALTPPRPLPTRHPLPPPATPQ
jgi:hypothetical protein